MDSQELNNVAVKNFQEYLRIPSVHPNINYDACEKFLTNYAKNLNLSCKVIYILPDKPMVILTWVGIDPSLKSIMLNSHMDVVPVEEDKWTQKPFGAEIVEGVIYARGSQDCKCLGIQYLEAIRRLKQNNILLKRTVHVTFACDEETTGDGMRNFVNHEFFAKMNIGVAFDEGDYSLDEGYLTIYYAERHQLCVKFHCTGEASHACLLEKGTAVEKMQKLLNKIYEFRAVESSKVACIDDLGSVTTVNVTMISGGVQANVVPAEFEMVMDSRLAPDIDIKDFENMLHKWCKEIDNNNGIYFEILEYNDMDKPTVINEENIFYTALKNSMQEIGYKLKLLVCSGCSDVRFIRNKNIPGFNLSPLMDTPIRLHSHDECLSVEVFLKGIEIYYKLIIGLANA